MARRAAAPPTVDDLLVRMAALEQRLLLLETGRVGPGDGRAAVTRPARPVRRCPGCGLPLRRRHGRCAACKRPLDSI
jgi:predicted amidophosphoribosyltransferase